MTEYRNCGDRSVVKEQGRVSNCMKLGVSVLFSFAYEVPCSPALVPALLRSQLLPSSHTDLHRSLQLCLRGGWCKVESSVFIWNWRERLEMTCG